MCDHVWADVGYIKYAEPDKKMIREKIRHKDKRHQKFVFDAASKLCCPWDLTSVFIFHYQIREMKLYLNYSSNLFSGRVPFFLKGFFNVLQNYFGGLYLLFLRFFVALFFDRFIISDKR